MPNDEKEQSASMHGAEEGLMSGRTCRLPWCTEVFDPKRQNQDFCSPAHREAFHTTARNMGVAALGALEKDKEEAK